MKIQKRNSKYEAFDIQKIKRCLLVVRDVVGADVDIMPLVNNIVGKIIDGSDIPTVTDIQNIVESVLIDAGLVDMAKSYILYRYERDMLRERRLKPDPKLLSDYIFYAKYSRLGESYEESINRLMDMHKRMLKGCGVSGLLATVKPELLAKRILPSMRSLQFSGPAIETCNERMYNCSYTLIDRWWVFGDILYLLLCGCGVGYSVQWEHIQKLGKVLPIGRKVRHHVIADTICGWAEAVKELFHCYMFTGERVEYSYHLIRDEGAPLVTSGGRAPGHLGLKQALEQVRNILDRAANRQLRPIECHDIICHLAEAVLSGGVRRSSLISLFSPSDTEMMYSKTAGVFEPGVLNTQRCNANNSVVLVRGATDKEVFNRVMRISTEGYGEPGFLFVDNINEGCNPCGEIRLVPIDEVCGGTGFAFCNLTEIAINNCKNGKEFLGAVRAATILGTIQAMYTSFPYLDCGTGVSERISEQGRLIGVSITGIMDNVELSGDMNLIAEARRYVEEVNKNTACLLGISAAKRLTCIKPSGTASLLLGTSAGIHPHHARRYFRRVIMNNNESAGIWFRKKNPHMVTGVAGGEGVICFPVQCDDTGITLKNCHGRVALDWILQYYKHWIGDNGHAISATVLIMPGDDIRDTIWEHRGVINGLSFIGEETMGHYINAPREEVCGDDAERLWNYLICNASPVDWTGYAGSAGVINLAGGCDGEKCELKR